jgi:multiple antibiotic resistance protein
MFLNMTHKLTPKQKKQVVNTSMLVALAVALIFILVGDKGFTFFHITLFDFKIAGGIVLLLVSLADLVGGPEKINQSSGSTGVVPLAVPLITGPGVITTLVLQVNGVGHLMALAALIANYSLAWVIFRYSEKVTRLIGKDGTMVISKIAALILAAIAVSMIRSGVFEAIRNFQIP